ncbi:MAG: hypothetical protein QM628_15715 [Propionicimonas sp.]
MSVLDTLTAAQTLADGFGPGGHAVMFLAHSSADTPAAKADQRRLNEHAGDIPAWIERAETFYVDSGMVPLVCSAGAVLPDDDPLHVYDPPSPYGFLLIDGGATVCSFHEPSGTGRVSAEPFTAFLWATFGGQIYVHRFGQSEGTWLLLDATSMPIEQPLPQSAREKDRTTARRIVVPGGRQTSQHRGVELPLGPECRDLLDDASQHTSEVTLRWLLACWRLMGQTVTEVGFDKPSRQHRRQLERKNVPLKQVTIIRLRHRGARGDGGTAVNWSHRWVVRGHWRQQPCKDENGEWTTRPVFIHPHIKGPESAPILVRSHVNYLVR